MKKQLTKLRSNRRRLLAGAGASGLAMATAVFGRSTPAHAANWACCTLSFVPPNITYANCTGSPHWVWQCTFGTVGPVYRYNCCEKYNAAKTAYVGSATKYTCISNCG
ncbi:hypothetical protein Vqi01_08160 [Micromonospora qiuiae]|uniref:Twin-arginine translocation signal domain-containing protein n=1 Tax=Micromonospora qiuiae TaxID=502268 RepID=A0ABQ4J662_9ACTN|nr:hypothetical protein [Micromonospora qiuiae]GIJ25654.1 hypothetical protein Vqi01_08160 [Micromonospora qiuiae]